MRFRDTIMTMLGGLLLVLAASGAQAQAAREEGILLESAQVLEELRGTPEKAIPDRLLERAYGIAIFPGLLKGAFFVGGRHGDGVFIQRDQDGRFTSPFFVSLTGGSFGFQFGAQKEDIVLVFTTRRGVEGVTGGKITLGGDASVAVGPVGRDASASTDVGLAEIYSYSRAKGLFAGIALDGSVMTVDSGSNAKFYKKPGVLATEIAAGKVTSDYEAQHRFMKAVGISTGSAPIADPKEAAPPAAAVPPPAAPASPSAARAFPLTSEPVNGREAPAEPEPQQAEPQPQP